MRHISDLILNISFKAFFTFLSVFTGAAIGMMVRGGLFVLFGLTGVITEILLELVDKALSPMYSITLDEFRIRMSGLYPLKTLYHDDDPKDLAWDIAAGAAGGAIFAWFWVGPNWIPLDFGQLDSYVIFLFPCGLVALRHSGRFVLFFNRAIRDKAGKAERAASRKAVADIKSVIEGLDSSEYEVLRRIVICEDLCETAVQLGEESFFLRNLTGPNKITLLQEEVCRLRAISTPAVLESVDRHRNVMNCAWTDLIQAGEMKNENDGEQIEHPPHYKLQSYCDRIERRYFNEPSRAKPSDADYIRAMKWYLTRVYMNRILNEAV